MRKLLITLLLAGAAATPALSQDRMFRSDDGQSRQERREARQERQQARETARTERSADRPSFPGLRSDQREQPSVEARARATARVEADRESLQQLRDARREARETRSGERIEDVQGRFQQRQDALRSGGLRQPDRAVPNVMRSRTPLIVSDTPRQGTQPPLRTLEGRAHHTQWNRDWRNDHRYDWRNHRRHHRSTFRVGIYYDPFGWNYRPYEIGWRMWPSYYSNRYRISDPWMYRLPYAPPGYAWVRYWDDALLIDTWTGTVVDRIPSFFW